MIARIGRVPLHAQPQPRRIEFRVIGHGTDDHRVDPQDRRQSARFAWTVEIDAMGDDRFLDHAQRHDLEARRGLQFGEVSHRHLAAVDGRLVALIEERRHRHPAELREGIANHRLMSDLGHNEAAPADAPDQSRDEDRVEKLVA